MSFSDAPGRRVAGEQDIDKRRWGHEKTAIIRRDGKSMAYAVVKENYCYCANNTGKHSEAKAQGEYGSAQECASDRHSMADPTCN